jgi:hypothetical protein
MAGGSTAAEIEARFDTILMRIKFSGVKLD